MGYLDVFLQFFLFFFVIFFSVHRYAGDELFLSPVRSFGVSSALLTHPSGMVDTVLAAHIFFWEK